jgi:hypothetical protein
MGYDIELESEALADLARLDPVLASLLLDEIDRCAVNPTRYSRRAGLPYLPYQRFEIRLVHEGVTHFFAVLYQYGQDEQTLHVRFIGHSVIG